MRNPMAIRRGPTGAVVGQFHHRARLRDSEVDLMLALIAAGASYAVVAQKFEVSKSCVQHIVSGRCRK